MLLNHKSGILLLVLAALVVVFAVTRADEEEPVVAALESSSPTATNKAKSDLRKGLLANSPQAKSRARVTSGLTDTPASMVVSPRVLVVLGEQLVQWRYMTLHTADDREFRSDGPGLMSVPAVLLEERAVAGGHADGFMIEQVDDLPAEVALNGDLLLRMIPGPTIRVRDEMTGVLLDDARVSLELKDTEGVPISLRTHPLVVPIPHERATVRVAAPGYAEEEVFLAFGDSEEEVFLKPGCELVVYYTQLVAEESRLAVRRRGDVIASLHLGKPSGQHTFWLPPGPCIVQLEGRPSAWAEWSPVDRQYCMLNAEPTTSPQTVRLLGDRERNAIVCEVVFASEDHVFPAVLRVWDEASNLVAQAVVPLESGDGASGSRVMRFPEMLPGILRIRAFPGNVEALVEAVFDSESTVRLDLGAAHQVWVRAYDADSGEVLPNAVARFVDLESGGGFWTLKPALDLDSPGLQRGWFAGDRATLWVEADGYSKWREVVELTESETEVHAVLQATPSSWIEVKLEFRGKPISIQPQEVFEHMKILADNGQSLPISDMRGTGGADMLWREFGLRVEHVGHVTIQLDGFRGYGETSTEVRLLPDDSISLTIQLTEH